MNYNYSKIEIEEKHIKIKREIEELINSSPKIENGFTLKTYNQGSYKKSTNIEGSDIDILITVNPFPQNMSKYNTKSINDILQWEKDCNNMPYIDGNFEDFGMTKEEQENNFAKKFNRNISGKEVVIDSIKTIKNYLFEMLQKNNFDVSFSSKTLKVKKGDMEFDIVPSIMYYYIKPKTNKFYGVGISIWDDVKNELIVNFPANEWNNTTSKNKRTTTYLGVVKKFKIFAKENKFEIPGYVIETILYNVPDSSFRYILDDSIKSVLNYLIDNIWNFSKFTTIDEIPKNFDTVNKYVSKYHHEWNLLINKMKWEL